MDKEGEQRSYLEFFIFLVILIALLVYVFRESLSFFKMDKKVYREKKEDWIGGQRKVKTKILENRDQKKGKGNEKQKKKRE